MLLISLLSFVGLLVISILIGKAVLNLRFRQQSKLLYSLSKNISNTHFHYGQLAALPEVVQRYFKHVLKEGQPYISNVSFTHDGQFKAGIDKNWMSIAGQHFATMERPGFIWKGVTMMFTARDMYIKDQGRLVVALFSLINVVNARGESYNQGELLRWLGESVLYPTNLLPSDRLKWSEIDSQHAGLILTYKGMSLPFKITFNALGEITQMETERYMDASNLKPWLINMSDYKEMSGVLVPSRFEVLWRLEKGDFSYARFNILRLEYNIPAA